MKRREFIKKATLTTAGAFVAPYILPSGRLFAPSGTRKANHVVFVLFGGGIRNQESVYQKYLSDQGRPSSGNIMNNMLTGAAPTSDIVYNQWAPLLTNSLQSQGVLFKEMRYTTGPTGHYNGHTVAMTGNYTATGLNLNVNPEHPTIFEYYRKHNSPTETALKAWWLSEGLGPYPSLNYSRHQDYGANYGANYLCPSHFITTNGLNNLNLASAYQPDDVTRIETMKTFFDANFDKSASDLPGIINTREDKEKIKNMLINYKSTADTEENAAIRTHHEETFASEKELRAFMSQAGFTDYKIPKHDLGIYYDEGLTIKKGENDWTVKITS